MLLGEHRISAYYKLLSLTIDNFMAEFFTAPIAIITIGNTNEMYILGIPNGLSSTRPQIKAADTPNTIDQNAYSSLMLLLNSPNKITTVIGAVQGNAVKYKNGNISVIFPKAT